jgi:hypothetical protein
MAPRAHSRAPFAVAALACLALAVWALTQPPNNPPTAPTVKVYSRETIVDVTVTDSKGNPVHGLTKENFTVKEDNKPQPIRSFEEHGVNGGAEERWVRRDALEDAEAAGRVPGAEDCGAGAGGHLLEIRHGGELGAALAAQRTSQIDGAGDRFSWWAAFGGKDGSGVGEIEPEDIGCSIACGRLQVGVDVGWEFGRG